MRARDRVNCGVWCSAIAFCEYVKERWWSKREKESKASQETFASARWRNCIMGLSSSNVSSDYQWCLCDIIHFLISHDLLSYASSLECRIKVNWSLWSATIGKYDTRSVVLSKLQLLFIFFFNIRIAYLHPRKCWNTRVCVGIAVPVSSLRDTRTVTKGYN